MGGIQRSDVVVACTLAVLAGIVGGGNVVAGAALLVFLGGIYLSLRLTRGQPPRRRALAVVAAFVLPVGAALLALRWVTAAGAPSPLSRRRRSPLAESLLPIRSGRS